MNRLFHKYAHYALALSMFLVVLSPASGMGGDGRQGQGMLLAKLAPDTPIATVEPAVFDKTHPAVRAAMAVQNRHTRDLLAIPEVVGTAIGLTDAGRPAVLVFTRAETTFGAIPASLDGVPTVVRVTGEIVALKPAGKGSSTTAVLTPPVPIGVSTGNANECAAGTIGARVISGTTVYALSNNHVYAQENAAALGSQEVQPGLYDTQCLLRSNNLLGTLAAFVPIQFNNSTCDPAANPSACNVVDAAIALSSTAALGNSTPGNGYGIPNSSTYVSVNPNGPYVGQPVQKYGRTTSLTSGTITGLNATVTVSYGTGKSAVFMDQIVIGSNKPFSKAGDSGSLIVTNDTHAYPVGLLFAGGTGTTIANPIEDVLGSFSVTIDGTSR
ncbi:MAG TPA: hypothetical protein VIU40_10635 [Geobacteraceae bacterium]